MKQIVIVGGGETFDEYEDYLSWLRSTEFDIFSKASGWKSNLQKNLGSQYQVINVKMPNPLNAKYEEWCIYMDKVWSFVNPGAVFVGHSLGGLFLLKYLSGRTQNIGQDVLDQWKQPLATVFVASPFDIRGSTGYADFKLRDDHNHRAFGKIHWFHSPQDDIVTAHHSYMGQLCLGGDLHLLVGRGHFIYDNKFPELIKTIKTTWQKSPKQKNTASSKQS